MAISFPTDLDALTNPTATDYLNSPSHSAQHANANDILEALEAKVGKDGSAVTTSHDYKLTATGKGVAINALTEKTTPVDADMVGLMDSAASNILKKLSWTNIKATLKTYFDTLYPTGGVGAWTSYNPTPTNFVKGAGGTLEGWYTQIGKTVIGKVHFQFGTGSSVSGQMIITLPVTAGGVLSSSCGRAQFTDAGTQIYFGEVQFVTTTTVSINPCNVAGTYLITVPSSSTVPFTWTTNDEFWLEFEYEAA